MYNQSKFKIRRGYYINKDKIRTQKSYGCFSLPKSLLSYTSWKRGDLIKFVGLTNVIMMQRIYTKEKLEKLKERQKDDYIREWCKKISKIGGDKKTHREVLGFKTFPERLISDLNLKNNQIIYFLPATTTYFNKGKNPDSSKEIVFIAFNEEGLRDLEELPKGDEENENYIFKRRMGDHYNLRLYPGQTEMTDKNTKRSKIHFKKVIEENLPNDAIKRIGGQIERMEKEMEEYKSGKLGTERNRKSIIKSLRRSIKHFKGIVKEIKKDLRIVYYPELRNKNVNPPGEEPNKKKMKQNDKIWEKFKKENNGGKKGNISST